MSPQSPNIPCDAARNDIAPTLAPSEALVDPLAGTLMPSSMSPTADKGVALPTQCPMEAGGLPGGVPGYEVLEKVGRGGMGVVYKARQVNADRVVALKMILGGTQAGAEAVARFRTEAQAVARLQHPNVVQVHEVGEHEGQPYFSLEFCSGGSLEKKLGGTPIREKDAAALVEKLALATQAAHEEQIIHRDLKPGNVLLSADGSPKIADFGLAKRLTDSGQTQSGAVVGTPSYMAPEQAAGKKDIGPACDIYSLGAILYDCLTGRPPFKAATVMDTLRQVAHEEPVSPRALNAEVSIDLETICLKCLQKEPGKRYGSARELAEDLRRFQAGEPIAARPVGRLERGWRWCRRNPALAAMTATAFLLLTAGVTVTSVLAVLADKRADEAANEREKAEKKGVEAIAAQQETEKVNQKLRESRERLELSVARGVLRSLVQRGQMLTNPEIEALWELATVPEEGVRHKFVEDALRNPVTIEQLRFRAEVAMQADVGLDPNRREKIERLLTNAAMNDQLFPSQKVNLGVVLARLGGTTSVTTTQAIIRAMSEASKDSDALRELTEGLRVIAARMELRDTAIQSRAIATVTQLMSRVGDTNKRELATCLSAVAANMKPQEAAALLSNAMSEAKFTKPSRELALGLSAAAIRMEPQEATEILLKALNIVKGSHGSRELAECLSAIAVHMEPEAAANACSQAGATLAQALKGIRLPEWSLNLAKGLSAVAARMKPNEAVTVLAQAFSDTSHRDSLRELGQSLSHAALWAEPKEAAAVLTQALSTATNSESLRLLTICLSKYNGA